MACRTPSLLAAVFFALVLAASTAIGLANPVEHVVQPGENLSGIAKDYGTTVEKLVELNNISNPNRLLVGQRLTIFDDAPKVHVIQRGETLWDIARAYGLNVTQVALWNGISDPSRIYPGQELIVSPQGVYHTVRRGENASVIAQRYGVTVEALAQVNLLKDPNRIVAGETLLIPPMGGGAVQALAGQRGLTVRRAFDRWPLTGAISSEFGMRGGRPHEGIDIAAAHGTPVRAVAAGTVTYADWAGTYGMLVMIDHGSGIETRYAHNSQINVTQGQTVSAGQTIARVGSTGRSTGPHLHFEVRVNGEAVDPATWLP